MLVPYTLKLPTVVCNNINIRRAIRIVIMISRIYLDIVLKLLEYLTLDYILKYYFQPLQPAFLIYFKKFNELFLIL